jgi:inosine-uridine nucleoside N-ribohydrolase
MAIYAFQIPVYVGATRGLVEEYNHEGPPFHGEDGFGNTKFDKIPDLTKIKKDESACLAILKVVKSMPGKKKQMNPNFYILNSLY